MLIHTTHYVQPHFAMRDRLNDLLDVFRSKWNQGDHSDFLAAYGLEGTKVAEIATAPLPAWSVVEAEIAAVLREVRVVVDNGSSDDRLDYGRIDNGEPVVETVIAVGGGTLSRGLTLEGLVVSYFTRTSNTYDTLLQMGRWFGYRPQYEDLPRIWMQRSLAEEFKFLALVEEEIRQDMLHMERANVTPRELGVRVRAHPGRLAIVARNKMQHAQIVRISYAGQRVQTFIFDELNAEILEANRKAIFNFLQSCREAVPAVRAPSAPRWLFGDVPASLVVSLINSYQFHVDQVSMRPDHMTGWIQRAAPGNPWNVVVIGSEKVHKHSDGSIVELGSVDLGLSALVPAVNRAPLSTSLRGTANIKALLSHNDWFADLDADYVKSLGDDSKDPRKVRRKQCDGRGLVVIYPVSKDSVPMGPARRTGSRRAMEAPDHLFGIGLIFPELERDRYAEEGTYYSVHPDWEVAVEEEEDEIPEDREGSFTVDGNKVVPRS
jgi:hypothetical protein